MPTSNAPMSEYMHEWYESVGSQDKQAVRLIAEVMGIDVVSTLSSENTFADYTNLSFTYENESSIVPVNSADQWDGWTQGVWEKKPNGIISKKPMDYLEFDEMETLSNWMYVFTPQAK